MENDPQSARLNFFQITLINTSGFYGGHRRENGPFSGSLSAQRKLRTLLISRHRWWNFTIQQRGAERAFCFAFTLQQLSFHAGDVLRFSLTRPQWRLNASILCAKCAISLSRRCFNFTLAFFHELMKPFKLQFLCFWFEIYANYIHFSFIAAARILILSNKIIFEF